MPRKKLPVPATASSVLEYFQTANVETAKTILELVTAEVAKRTPKTEPLATKPRKAGKKPPSAPAEYGESLSNA